MNNNPKTLVIIPAFNEQYNIGGVVCSIKRVLPDVDILVINDGSIDQTALKALQVGSKVISHIFNLGYGASLETGYIYAFENGYDCILQMDGDGQHLAEELPVLLKCLHDRGADIVIGDRFTHGMNSFESLSIRRIGQKLFAIILSGLSGFNASDPTSGFQCLSRKALYLFTSGMFPHDYPDADAILIAIFAGLKINEVPVRMTKRTVGQSMHAGLKPIYYVFKMLMSLFIVLLNKKKIREYMKRLDQ